MKPETIQIVQAQPGYFAIYEYKDEKELEVGESVIAWRIETFKKRDCEELFSVCVPLTVDGDAVMNCIGVMNPDKSVTIFEETTYSTLSDLKQQKYSGNQLTGV